MTLSQKQQSVGPILVEICRHPRVEHQDVVNTRTPIGEVGVQTQLPAVGETVGFQPPKVGKTTCRVPESSA